MYKHSYMDDYFEQQANHVASFYNKKDRLSEPVLDLEDYKKYIALL